MGVKQELPMSSTQRNCYGLNKFQPGFRLVTAICLGPSESFRRTKLGRGVCLTLARIVYLASAFHSSRAFGTREDRTTDPVKP